MEHGASVASLVIVVIAAFLTPILLHRFKLTIIPVVVAEIIVGLIIGKSGFDIVEPDIWLETLSMLGFIFLMFLSGLEIDFSAFAGSKKKEVLPLGKQAPNAFQAASVIFIAVFIISYLLSLVFVWAGFVDNAFLMTLIISTISLGVVVPTLKDAQIMKTNIGQIILLVAVIADLVTMVLLAVFVSMFGETHGNMWLLLILFAVGVLFYFVGKHYRHQSFIETMTRGTIQIDTRAVFALIIVLVGLSETVGAENILGAFLAGVLVSLLSPNSEMVQKLDSFGYGFLIPIFFVMIGVELNLWSLLSDPKLLLMIPLLLIGLLLSKLIPVLWLRRWYDWNTVIASGFILTSTLSLVIAAAHIGERMGMITSKMSGALILVAVLTCIITPIVFKKFLPRVESENKKVKVVFIGSNRLTLPITKELDPKLYKTYLFHTKQEKKEADIPRSSFDIVDVEDYSVEELRNKKVFDTDILVAATGNEDVNIKIATFAKEYGIERVIARTDDPESEQGLKDAGIEILSVYMSSKALLKAMIESPSVVDIFTKQENALFEIHMNNSQYDGTMIRNFPFAGDVIMVRIYRGKDSIVPHGDTELKLGDRLVVTGSSEYVEELRHLLEFCDWC